MKILKCYIENFGKLHQVEKEFNEGLNVIKEQNGYGKTTFAIFIKSMFYGLDARAKIKTENSERKKYYPWQGGNYGGNLDFEIEGKQYRIERFFGKKAQDDTFKLYDLSTNLESTDYTENIGEEIFKINKSGYERSTYIPQGNIQISMEDSISAKLGNVLENENDINTSEDAIKKINETKKIYIKDKGKSGLIDEKKEILNRLERNLENSKTDADILTAKQQKLAELNNQIKEQEQIREAKQKELSNKLEQEKKLAKFETYKTIKSKYKELQEKLENTEQYLKKGMPEKFKGPNVEEEIDEAIKNSYTILEIQKELEIKQKEKENLQQEISKYKKMYVILLIIGIIILTAGIAIKIAKIQEIIGIVGIIIGAISVCLSMVIYRKGTQFKTSDVSNKIKEQTKQMQELEAQVEQVLRLSDSTNTNHIIVLTDLKTEYKSCKEMQAIKENEYNYSKQQFELAKQEKEKFEHENSIEEIEQNSEMNEISETNIKQEINEINQQIDKMVDEKNQVKNQIEFLENKIDENEYLETDIENLKEEIEHLSNKYQILSKTEQLLKAAKESFSSSYLHEMVQGFNNYLSIINKESLSTNVDINLDVNIDVNGSQKEAKYFSAGYKDLIYICMRLSLIKALFKEEKPFVVLDDPFVNLDEEKTAKALEIVREIAKDYQIIYFVCNKSRT